MYEKYRLSAWGFEVFVLLQRFLLIVALVFILPGSVSQTILATVFALTAAFITLFFRPFSDGRLSTLNFMIETATAVRDFRAAVVGIKLTHKNVSVYAEIEVHFNEILKIGLSPAARAYEHYNFFRRRLKGTVPMKELDALLEEKLIFLVDATGIPVLLSLLVLIFTSGGEDLTKVLPQLFRPSPHLPSHTLHTSCTPPLTPAPLLLHTSLHSCRPTGSSCTTSASSRRSTSGSCPATGPRPTCSYTTGSGCST